MSLSDSMLSGSAIPALQSVHSELVQVIGTGPDAGRFFNGIREIEQDFEFEGEVATDRRAKRMVRFPVGASPNLGKLDRLRTSDGKTWVATVRPGAAYLTVDFELIEKI